MGKAHLCPVCQARETRTPVCVICKLDPDKKDQVIKAMGFEDKRKREKLKYFCIEGCRTPVDDSGKRCAKCTVGLRSAAPGPAVPYETLAEDLRDADFKDNITPRGSNESETVGHAGKTGEEKKMSRESTVTKKLRKCKECEQEYMPTGNRQEYCLDCKGSHSKNHSAKMAAPKKKRTYTKRATIEEAHNTYIERKKKFQAEVSIAGLPRPGVSLTGTSELIRDKVLKAQEALAEVAALL